MTDGLSNTLGFAEKLVGTPEGGPFDPKRDWIYILNLDGNGSNLTLSQWTETCEHPFVRDPGSVPSGGSWLVGQNTSTLLYAGCRPTLFSPIARAGPRACFRREVSIPAVSTFPWPTAPSALCAMASPSTFGGHWEREQAARSFRRLTDA